MMKCNKRDYFQSYTVLMSFMVYESEANKDEQGLSLNLNTLDTKELKLKQEPLHNYVNIISFFNMFSVMSNSDVKVI